MWTVVREVLCTDLAILLIFTAFWLISPGNSILFTRLGDTHGLSMRLTVDVLLKAAK